MAAGGSLFWVELAPGALFRHRAEDISMSLLLIIVLLVLIFGGGGGYYAHRNYGGRGLGGVLGLVLIIVLVLYLLGGARF
jgi:hypothetical protein